MSMWCRRCLVLLASGLLFAWASAAWSAPPTDSEILKQVDYRQRIGKVLPGELRFRDRHGDLVSIDSLTDGKPLVLALAWYNCPQLCPMLLDRIAQATAALPFDRQDYRVAIVSIASEEGPEDAQRVARELKGRHADETSEWYLLTGVKPAIDALADAAGFDYAHDPESGDYAHPAGIVVASPGGTITHYLLGMQPETPDLKLALVEAGKGELGTPLQKLLVRCYRFDPETGQYNLAVMNLLRITGGGSVLALAGGLLWMRRRERS